MEQKHRLLKVGRYIPTFYILKKLEKKKRSYVDKPDIYLPLYTTNYLPTT